MTPATRKLIVRLHLWLGLPAAAVYLVIALTGALLVYEKDLDRAWHPELWRTDATAAALPLATLHAHAQAAAPGLALKEVRLETAARTGAPVEFRFEPGPHVRLDPGTGAILGTRARRASFFGRVEQLHQNLLLGPVGKWTVTTATVVLLGLLATGLVLWWPKQWRLLRQAVTLALHRRGRALHFNLHNTLGFWAALPLAAVALTGAILAIKPLGELLRGNSRPERAPPAAVSPAALPPASLDTLVAAARSAFPDARQLRLHAPRAASDARAAAETWRVEAVAASAAHEHARSRAWLDPRTAAVLRLDRFADLPLGARLRALARPLHDGSLWGRPSQLVAFLSVLVLPVLSVTGGVLWWLRRRAQPCPAAGPAPARSATAPGPRGRLVPLPAVDASRPSAHPPSVGDALSLRHRHHRSCVPPAVPPSPRPSRATLPSRP
jgi:uncharacterized iron-regulated membrane protein